MILADLLTALADWSGAHTGWELALIAFGLFGQAMFFSRWIVQWHATERQGQPIMPMSFWWLSLGGASCLLLYFILRREPVGALGQSIGWIVYTRNIMLSRKSRHNSRSS